MEPIKADVQQNVVQLNEQCRSALQCLSNTISFVAHDELAFRKFADLCELQKDGVHSGDQYKNFKACKTFYIAQVERDKIQSAVRDSRFFSIVSDGSTDSGIEEQDTAYVIHVNKKGGPVCHFVNIVALDLPMQIEFCMESLRVFLALA